MDFAQHLFSYYKGEWLEAVFLTAFGMVTTCLAIVMWKYIGHNTLLKGFFYPMAFLAAFSLLTGGRQIYSNSQRLETMPVHYAQYPTKFIQAERDRFEGSNGVNSWWLPLKVLWAVLVIAGIAVSFSTRNDHAHGIAIGLIVIGATGFVIDGFAHQRARVYTAILLSK